MVDRIIYWVVSIKFSYIHASEREYTRSTIFAQDLFSRTRKVSTYVQYKYDPEIVFAKMLDSYIAKMQQLRFFCKDYSSHYESRK